MRIAQIAVALSLLVPSFLFADNPSVIDEVKVYDSGTRIATILLAERPAITMNGNTVTIAWTTDTLHFEGKNITAKFDSSMGVESVTRDDIPSIRLDGDMVEISGLRPYVPVSIISADGKISSITKADSEGNASLQLNGKGIYVIAAGKLSFKVAR